MLSVTEERNPIITIRTMDEIHSQRQMCTFKIVNLTASINEFLHCACTKPHHPHDMHESPSRGAHHISAWQHVHPYTYTSINEQKTANIHKTAPIRTFFVVSISAVTLSSLLCAGLTAPPGGAAPGALPAAGAGTAAAGLDAIT
jgi:hypothetical protein